jgi:hypothetical protein
MVEKKRNAGAPVEYRIRLLKAAFIEKDCGQWGGLREWAQIGVLIG